MSFPLSLVTLLCPAQMSPETSLSKWSFLLYFFWTVVVVHCDELCLPSCTRCRIRHCKQGYKERLRVNMTLDSALHLDVHISSVPTNTPLCSIYIAGFHLRFVDNYLLLYRNVLCMFTKYVCTWCMYEIIVHTLRMSKYNRRNWFVT